MSAKAMIEDQGVKLNGITSQFEVVSPTKATKWLEGNVHNRTVQDSRVQKYAEDMRRGRWKQTHQGIAFDEDAGLIDGQHRLFAVVYADVDVVMQVTRGLPRDTQLVVDDGIKRSVVDIMKVNGRHMEGLTTVHAGASEAMFRGLSPSRPRLRTRQDQQEWLQKHWEAISFATGMFIAKRVRGVSTAPVIAVFARAFYHEPHDKLAHFAEVLIDGMSASEADFAAIKLRNWLVTKQSNGGTGAVATETYAKTLKCLYDGLRGKPIGRNLVPATSEHYAIKGGL